jgi:hypothetical protein
MGDPAIINDVIKQTSFADFFCIGSASLRPSICKYQIVTSPVIKFSPFLCFPVCRQSSLLTREEGLGEGEGAKSYDSEKAWSSIIYQLLSDPNPLSYLFYVVYVVNKTFNA